MSGTQLRIYRIAAGHLADFVAAWEAGVRPLRERAGFASEAWTDAADDTFVWLLHHSGSDAFETADRRYYASAERAAVEPDPAQWIVAATNRMIERVPAVAPAARSRRTVADE
jgi:hypothetical protein